MAWYRLLGIRMILVLVFAMAAMTTACDASNEGQAIGLANPGFEEGDVGAFVPGWTRRTVIAGGSEAPVKFVVAEGGRSGGKKAVLEGRDGSSLIVQQVIPLEVDENHTAIFSVWMRAETPIPNVGLHLYLTQRGEIQGGPFKARSTVAVESQWKRYEISLSLGCIAAVRDSIPLNFRPIVQLGSPQRLELDDASLTVVKSEMSPEERWKAETIRTVFAEDKTPHVKAPIGDFGGIVPRPDGKLFAFTHDFQLRVSEDHGRTWSEPRKLAIDDPLDKITGAIAISDGSMGIWTESWEAPLHFWKSEDNGKTWSKRIQIAEKGAPYHGNVMMEMRVNKELRGRLVIPVRRGYAFYGLKGERGFPSDGESGAWGTLPFGKRVCVEGHGHMGENVITFVHYSDDGGLTWKGRWGGSEPVFIWKDKGRGGIWMADEPNIAELSDGRLLMFMRCPLGRIYQSFSPDGGLRWSYPEPTEIPSSLSPCSLKRIPENAYTLSTGRAGHLVCVWNNVSKEEIELGHRRGRLSVAISKDDGKTWINAKTIDTTTLSPIKGMAPLSPPGMTRAKDDVGEVTMIGHVHYADIYFAGDKVIIKYEKFFDFPRFHMGSRMQIHPLDWLYEEE